MTITEERLRELGEEYLSEEGRELLEETFLNETLDGAKLFILGALDGLWERGQVSEEEVRPIYMEISVDPERARRVRQHHALNP
jgi:hypothetical protein